MCAPVEYRKPATARNRRFVPEHTRATLHYPVEPELVRRDQEDGQVFADDVIVDHCRAAHVEGEGVHDGTRRIGFVPGQARAYCRVEEHVPSGRVDFVVRGAQDVDGTAEIVCSLRVEALRMHRMGQSPFEIHEKVIGEQPDVGVGNTLGRRRALREIPARLARTVHESAVESFAGLDLDLHRVGVDPLHAERGFAVADVRPRDTPVAFPPVVAVGVERFESRVVRYPEECAGEVVRQLSDHGQIERLGFLVPRRERSVQELVRGVPVDVRGATRRGRCVPPDDGRREGSR